MGSVQGIRRADSRRGGVHEGDARIDGFGLGLKFPAAGFRPWRAAVNKRGGTVRKQGLAEAGTPSPEQNRDAADEQPLPEIPLKKGVTRPPPAGKMRFPVRPRSGGRGRRATPSRL